jgi:hypothetical protein
MNLNEVIKDINRENWEGNLIKQFNKKYNNENKLDIMYKNYLINFLSDVTEEAIIGNDVMSNTIKELTSWDWLFQYTP